VLASTVWPIVRERDDDLRRRETGDPAAKSKVDCAAIGDDEHAGRPDLGEPVPPNSYV